MTAGSEGVDQAALPFGLERGRHLDRDHSAWRRRAVVVVMSAFCTLALFNVFGQVAHVDHADGAAASLTVESPERLRGGDIYTTVITVSTHQPVQDVKVLLSPGWFSGFTLNAAAPQSGQDASTVQGDILDYGQLDAGFTMPIWISWQVNPTTVGEKDQDVEILDGSRLLVAVHRSVYVFP